jgi:hypothetical protein
MSKRSIGPNLKTLTEDARTLVMQLDAMGQDLEKQLTLALERAWRLGQKLLSIKALVGHGNWLTWLEANLTIGPRHAQRHMELAASNLEADQVKELSAESVRKFRLRYVPDKERPQLEGDQSLPRVCHHLTIVNDFRRFQRRVEIGQAALDPSEAKRDLKPLFLWLCDLYGFKGENVAA